MPADRFLHPVLGHSEKVNSLTDLEARVWAMGYILAADDYGVMPCSAVIVQSANFALSQRPAATVQRCLEKMLEVELLAEFEHQRRRFVFQRDWQKYQKVRYPRDTINPCPSAGALQTCDHDTFALFQEHHPGFTAALQQNTGSAPDALQGDKPKPERLITANGLRLTANGSEEKESGSRARFAQFWDAYPRRVGKDAAWKLWLRLKPDAALLEVMLTAIAAQLQSAQWLESGGQFIPHPRTWLSRGQWQDEIQAARPSAGKQTTRLAEAVANIAREAHK